MNEHHDTFADLVTTGLEESELAELERSVGADFAAQRTQWESVAAKIALVYQSQETAEPLPQQLEQSILSSVGLTADSQNDVYSISTSVGTTESGSSSRIGMVSGWLAAAACLAFAVSSWWPVLMPPTAYQRFQQVASASDVIRADWAGGEGYDGVTGEIIWSDTLQLGCMKLTGLPANDPTREQYQLWIVDANRDKEPVDGGVFDVPEGSGPYYVMTDAKLSVARPSVFAITLEQPGGVVVSEGPLLVTAAPEP